MKKFLKIFLLIIVVLIMVLLAVKPEIFIKSVSFGIKLWAIVVLPSLLPFFFLTSLSSILGITELSVKFFKKPCEKLFRTSGISAYCFFMSAISGYPVGAKIIKDLYESGIIDEKESTKMSTFCSTSGPLFIIGSVGYGMFNDKSVGYIILLSHLLSAVFCGIIFGRIIKSEIKPTVLIKKENEGNVLYSLVYSSVVSVAVVGGFISIFYMLADAVSYLKLLLPLQKLLGLILDETTVNGITLGLIECTKGCQILSTVKNLKLSVPFSTFLISLGGLSVLFQSSSFLSSAKVNMKIFYLSKLMQAVISFCLASLFLLFI